jgi:hypothetical protein
MVVLQDCTDSQEDVLGSCIETYPASSQTTNIKVEEFSDAEEDKDPLAIPFPEMKAEHVVSCFLSSLTDSCASAAACFVY